MDEDVKMVIDMMSETMQSSIDHLQKALTKIRAGKASPAMLAGIYVDYYGSSTPLAQVANVSAADARMLTVTPWEKNMIPVIEKAIRDANLGFNPGSDGDMVRIPIPLLTEERRKNLVKQANEEGENARIALRKSRNDANKELKDLKNDGTSEDAVKRGEDEVNKVTKSFDGKIDTILKAKEEDIMTV